MISDHERRTICEIRWSFANRHGSAVEARCKSTYIMLVYDLLWPASRSGRKSDSDKRRVSQRVAANEEVRKFYFGLDQESHKSFRERKHFAKRWQV